MADRETLMASARRILDGAARDLELGLWESACLSAHRAAVLATQAWLEDRGQVHVTDRVAENVALEPGADPGVRAAAAVLDRHRLEEGSFAGAERTAEGREEADGVVAAGRKVVAFVEGRLAGG